MPDMALVKEMDLSTKFPSKALAFRSAESNVVATPTFKSAVARLVKRGSKNFKEDTQYRTYLKNIRGDYSAVIYQV